MTDNASEGRLTSRLIPTTRRVFVGFGAIVARLHGVHLIGTDALQCSIVSSLGTDDNYFDNGPYMRLDFSTCYDNNGGDLAITLIDGLGQRANGTPMETCADRHEGIAVTTLGPRWPKGGFRGQIFLEETYYAKNRRFIEGVGRPWPPSRSAVPMDSHACQYVTIRYAGRRFMGFYGELRSPVSSIATNVDVEIHNPATDTFVSCNLAFADLDETAPDRVAGVQLYPVLKRGAQPGKVSVFLEFAAALQLWATDPQDPGAGLMTPKLPFWLG